MADLRSRQLRPGPGNAPDAVERNQRERLYGATVANVAEHGYESTRVADILALAAVSRSAFYRYFDNKRECFLATLDALAGLAAEPVAQLYASGSDADRRARLTSAFESLVLLILSQPAAARVWLIEIYAAGPEAVDRVERLTKRLDAFAVDAIGETPDRGGMPSEAVRAILGGLGQVIRSRLRNNRDEELLTLVPDLVDWALAYGAPPARLCRPRRPPALPSPTPDPDEQHRRIVASTIDLVGERGYQDVTITEIAQGAAVSLTTFYNHFDSKRAAFRAAVDETERQVFEVVLPVYQDAGDWPCAARDVIHAFLAFNANHPAASRLGGLQMLSGGSEGLDRHQTATTRFGSAISAGYQENPDVSPIVGEAVSGSLAALVYQQIRHRGPERLYEVAGIASYLALAPFVGADAACALSNEGWHPPPR